MAVATDLPNLPRRDDLRFAGAVAVAFLLIASILGAVWKIEDRFISRREFTDSMARIDAHLAEIDRHLGTSPPVVAPTPP